MIYRTDGEASSAECKRRQLGAGGIMLKRGALICLLGSALTLPGGSTAYANGAAAASAGLNDCSSRTSGKELYNCFAGVLETMAVQNSYAPQLQGAITRAASGLRAAVNKAQALLAVTQCQSVIATALQQAKAAGGRLGGFGSAEGMGHIVRVIGLAVRLIQAKG